MEIVPECSSTLLRSQCNIDLWEHCGSSLRDVTHLWKTTELYPVIAPKRIKHITSFGNIYKNILK
jgi:hypothetical protein